MNIRQMERRVSEMEQQRIDAACQAEKDWVVRFTRASLADIELSELTRSLAMLQMRHGPDSPEAQREYEVVRADFERIVETRYASFLDEPIE